MEVSVVIPTRNRPDKLAKCLQALEAARERLGFEVFVCDSSTDDAVHAEVVRVCEPFGFARVVRHDGRNVAAARNRCAQAATGELIVNVDDDIYVEPGAIRALYDRYMAGSGWRVVAGSVAWGDDWSTPVVMRPIGYARKARPGEAPSFLIGAFFIYSRALALALPWNERVRTSDDRFMGALWRSRGVQLLYEPSARAFHDHQHVRYGVEHQESHIYVNLFDAVIANPSLPRALAYEFLGFAAGLRKHGRNAREGAAFLRAWWKGNARFLKDYGFLRQYTRRPMGGPERRLQYQGVR